jgi:hypothetical protein
LIDIKLILNLSFAGGVGIGGAAIALLSTIYFTQAVSISIFKL